uniref:Nonribosomal peptide synthetase n=1 Tax=Nocardiopsis sp. CMB-M0232 TaxID=1231934 RepID=A0A0D5BUA1_9ACTN|nr:nonribosomal peptide synthetase [Nocardiopsis sp. CMB-M0232]
MNDRAAGTSRRREPGTAGRSPRGRGARLARVDRDGPLAASFAQRRMWFLDRLMPGNPSYNCPVVERVRGEFEPKLFAEALAAVVERHESLRTVITGEDGVPTQTVRDGSDIVCRIAEAEGDDAQARLESARRIARRELRETFDLGAGPLLRAVVVRLAEDDHVVCLVAHHACVDGWSLGVLVAELSAAYSARREGRPPVLPPLTVQYADFAAWEAERQRGRRHAKQIDYWTERLRGMPSTLGLSTDRPRPSLPNHEAGQLRFQIAPEPARRARELGAAEGATLYMTLLAVLNVVLAEHARSEDIAVGAPILNRPRAELEPLIGFFANTLVFRTDLSGDPTFRELLGRVRAVATGALAHSELPFEHIVESLQVERDLSHNPLVQLLFQLTSAAPGRFAFPGAESTEFPYGLIFTRMDLEIHLAENTADEGLTGHVVFSKELFDAETIELLVHHFTVGLEEALRDPDRPISSITLLDGSEREKLLADGRGAPLDLPEEPLHELFSAQARRTPDAVALVSGGDRLTYRELEERTNRLAHHLRGLGAGPETLVGLCVQRGFGIVEGMLGVLKSGAAYVPIDPALPAARIEFVLADTGLSHIVTDDGSAAALSGFGGGLVFVDRPEDFAPLPADPPATGTDITSLAYVIYTSGSTGVPKGILMPHRPIVNLVAWQKTVMAATPATRTAQFAALGFDISLQEVFSALLHGESVYLPQDDIRRDAAAFARWVADNGVHQVFLPNVMVQALSEEVDRTGAVLPELRHLSQAGERISLDAPLRRLLDRHPALRLHNHFGPSEAHVVTAYTFPERTGDWPQSAPVGRPVANTLLYVVDEDLEPVPTGVPGELCVAGAGLSRGYLGRPELTDRLFVPNPFAEGTRMYRTGDLVRWRWDGNLEFLGRIDDQVKIRGFRVEPGEVQAVLEQHDLVRQAVVVAFDDAAGAKRLVAYLTAHPGARASGSDFSGDLRAHVGAGLPEYMVPSAFVVLDALPLTAGGKVDRALLPAPQLRGALDIGYVAPRTPEEVRLCEIFADLLDAENVGAEDDFFALGGHSLIAARIIARINALFGVELPLRAVFDNRTPKTLGALVVRESDARRPAAPVLAPVGHDDPVPVSLSQENLLAAGCDPAVESGYTVPPLVFRLRGELDADALRRSFALLVERHSAVRTTFDVLDGRVVQKVHGAEGFAVEDVDLAGLPAAEREDRARELVSAEVSRAFDLARGPLLRVKLLRLAADEHVLSIVQHHITSDGWSQALLVREVSAIYSALLTGAEPVLPSLPVQYRDFSVWERATTAGGALDPHRAYWASQIARMRPVRLPTDRPRTPGSARRGQMISWHVPAESVRAARRLGGRIGASLYMTMLAAFAVVLRQRTGADDICVGTPVADRGRVEAEHLIGSFAKVIAVRAELHGDLTFEDVVELVRDGVLDGSAHQDLPLFVAMKELDPGRDLAADPALPVLFQMVDVPHAALALPKVEVAEFGFEWEFSTPVDLEVHLLRGEEPDEMAGFAILDRDLFDPDSVSGLLDATLRVLEHVSECPGLPVAELAARL